MAVSLEAETKVGMSFGPGMFSDDDFHRVAHEVVEPLLDGFEEFVESHGTKFYRKYKEVLRCVSCLFDDQCVNMHKIG